MSDAVSVAAEDVRAVIGGLAIAAGMLGATAAVLPAFAAAIEAGGRMAAATVMPMPDDPVTGIREAAIWRHELMAAHEEAGFSREESFARTLAVVQAIATGAALKGAR